MAWVESQSLSFAARHDDADVDAAARVLDDLEAFRVELEPLFERTPYDVTVVLHPRPLMLALAQPWLPVARLVAAPASRRYFCGWFSSREIHVLSPAALERRAAGAPGSRRALLRAARHEYAHVVVGANSRDLPPPFRPAAFARYLRWAWLAEGAATHLAGQVRHLRAAVVRRLHEGARPDFPPAPRDALLLGGTIFALLEHEAGPRAAAALATRRLHGPPGALIGSAFGRPLASVERDWRDLLDSLRAG